MKGVILRSDKINIPNRNKHITINSLLNQLHDKTLNFKSSPVHSGQAGGQKSWETKIHKCVRFLGAKFGSYGHDYES